MEPVNETERSPAPAGPTDATVESGDTTTHDGAGRTATVGGGDWQGTPIQLGASMGRYELRKLIGTGGMGVVFSAHDPELDRTVAVKILRAGSMAGSDGERRLRREGQTMARLTHPNVLRVYDVGVDHHHLFVAMEFVAGGTLAEWLEREPRTPAEIIEVFVQAGQGLAAAHDAGLVHRDFKPSNVLVDEDGRVMVTDFGLARLASGDPSSPSVPPAAALDSLAPASDAEPVSPLALSPIVTLTNDGQRVGTPAYMAPEQHAASHVDARADQFSFCVAVWRALYGSPPFAGATAGELATAARSGKTVAPPAGAATRVPPRVRAALERGLRARPEDRFPSMRPLLAALGPPPARGRWWLVAGPLAVVAIGSLAVWTQTRAGSKAGDVCAAQVDRAAEVWNPTVAGEIQAAFNATKASYAAEAFAEVSRQLDARVVAWESMRRDSCEATRLRREQSDAMRDVRAACLDRRLSDLREFVDELRRADEVAVRGAANGALSVGDVTACGDVATLSRRAPTPAGTPQRTAIALVERDLSVARAKNEAGRFPEVAALSEGLIARARATAYPPVLAEALAVSARAFGQVDKHDQAEVLLEEAVLAAESGGDDVIRFECEIALVQVVGVSLERDADGSRHAERAAALLARLGPDPRRAARLANARANLDWWHGRYAQGHKRAEESVALFRSVDPRGIELARSLHTRAILEDEQQMNEEAVATEDEALAIGEKVFGAGHPTVANMYNTRGGALRRMKRYEEARTSLRRALAINERVFGPEQQNVASAILNLATVDLDEEKYDDAIVLLRRGLAIYEKVLGPDHGRTALGVERLGSALSKGGHHVEAEAALLRAVDIHRKRLGPDSPALAQSYKQLGEHYLRAGQPGKAQPAYAEAVRAYHASQGPKTPMAVRSLSGLGDAEMALGHRAAAIAAWDEALASLEADSVTMREEITGKLARARGGTP